MKSQRTPTVSVPCNGCTACCRNDSIILHPECGDDPHSYLTERVIHPLTGRPVLALRRKADNSCHYLGENGCTIHDRAPAICREFDCRRFVQLYGPGRLKRMVASGQFSADVAEAGRQRRHSLPDAA